jgi:hypothetical protein
VLVRRTEKPEDLGHGRRFTRLNFFQSLPEACVDGGAYRGGQ